MVIFLIFGFIFVLFKKLFKHNTKNRNHLFEYKEQSDVVVSLCQHHGCLRKHTHACKHFERNYQISALLALCAGNPPATNGFPTQRAENVPSVFMLWCYHAVTMVIMRYCQTSMGNQRVAMVTALSSLAALEVVVMTTFGVIGDEKFVIMTALNFSANPLHHGDW